MPTDTLFLDARRGTFDCRPAPMCDARPVCPACGGLECLCRPRFFAGQLLSEEDLNRLDHYIVAKNRLHNRHLFGTGVVCGLEVVCGNCDPAVNGRVIVRPGYALSPCGNDIVVCRDESVDICDLINRCRARAPDDCYQPAGNVDDHQSSEEWVLAICYRETPSRGIAALRGDSCSCGRGEGCSCGGGTASSKGNATYTSGAGCGCAGGGSVSKAPARTKPAVKAGRVPAQCEPTLTCEGYTFAVYRVAKAGAKQRDPGPLIRRFLCCLQPLLDQLVSLPKPDEAGAPVSIAVRHEWLASLIAVVREFLLTEGLYDCDAASRLGAVALPSRQAGAEYPVLWSAATRSVLEIVAAIFQKCLCAALLPPCPPSELNDCVPIATLTVSNRQCRVRHICNIANRRFLPSIPAIQYWLSWLPLFFPWASAPANGAVPAQPRPQTLSDLIHRICCTPVSSFFPADVDVLSAVAAPPAPTAVRARVHPFSELLGESFAGAQPVNAATVLLAAMGAKNPNAEEARFVSDTALQHPAEAMLIHQVLGPLLAPLLPGVGASRPSAAAGEDLGAELERLKRTVEEQQRAIERLQRRR